MSAAVPELPDGLPFPLKTTEGVDSVEEKLIDPRTENLVSTVKTLHHLFEIVMQQGKRAASRGEVALHANENKGF